MRHHTHGHTGDPVYNSWSNMIQSGGTKHAYGYSWRFAEGSYGN